MITLAVTAGDMTGIGPEVALRSLRPAAQELPGTRFVLVGDARAMRQLDRRLDTGLAALESAAGGVARLWDPAPRALAEDLAPGAAEAAVAALEYLEAAARGCLRRDFDALVTGPVNKEAILRAGREFTGQTEFLTALAGGPPTTMMLLGSDDRGRWLRVALATTHVPLRRVAEALSASAIETAIRHAAGACRRLGLDRARVGVCGLNPHAGEGGLLGGEEVAMIAPAVNAARAAGCDVSGPVPADTLFFQALRGDFDAVVAMYHDQGLAPLKMIAFATGVNWTLGLPFVRTSPDHGTAYDIAGRGLADPSSMVSAVRLAARLVNP